MSDFIERDDILGVSKKIIKREPVDQVLTEVVQNDQTRENISAAISRMKEKSSELSDREIEIEAISIAVSHEDSSNKDVGQQETDINQEESIKTAEVISEVPSDIPKEIPKEIPIQDELVDQLRSEIAFLKTQIDVKDNQLGTKDKQLGTKDELILNFQVLLKSEQDKVLRLESEKMEEPSETDGDNRSWIVKLFGKKTR